MSHDSPVFHIDKEAISSSILRTTTVTVIIATSVSNQSSEFLSIKSEFNLLVTVLLIEVLTRLVTVIIKCYDIMRLDPVEWFVAYGSKITWVVTSTATITFFCVSIGIIVLIFRAACCIGYIIGEGSFLPAITFIIGRYYSYFLINWLWGSSIDLNVFEFGFHLVRSTVLCVNTTFEVMCFITIIFHCMFEWVVNIDLNITWRSVVNYFHVNPFVKNIWSNLSWMISPEAIIIYSQLEWCCMAVSTTKYLHNWNSICTRCYIKISFKYMNSRSCPSVMDGHLWSR